MGRLNLTEEDTSIPLPDNDGMMFTDAYRQRELDNQIHHADNFVWKVLATFVIVGCLFAGGIFYIFRPVFSDGYVEHLDKIQDRLIK